MKILTTNSAGNDRFGGIHTRKTEHIKYSPHYTFNIVELNKEKRYFSRENVNVHRLDTEDLTKGKSIFGILQDVKNFDEFNEGIERIVNEFQNAIREVNPNVIIIPGTSLTSYFLFKACRREGVLERTLHEYAGVLEKEIGNYTGDTRFILSQIGKQFVSDIALEKVTYLFPSNICKDVVEEIHGITFNEGHVVWNGISDEFIQKDFNRKAPDDLTLGYIGRVHHVKNLPFFLGINDNIEKPAKLKIITDLAAAAPKVTGKPLLEKITEGEVFFYHPRPKEELKLFYETQISASVVPSFFETYCNGAVESLVCGTPTLLSDKAGASEVYRKYELSNLLFSIDNISSFKDALENAEKRNFFIEEDLAKNIYEDLSWKKVIGKYNKIIERIG